MLAPPLNRRHHRRLSEPLKSQVLPVAARRRVESVQIRSGEGSPMKGSDRDKKFPCTSRFMVHGSGFRGGSGEDSGCRQSAGGGPFGCTQGRGRPAVQIPQSKYPPLVLAFRGSDFTVSASDGVPSTAFLHMKTDSLAIRLRWRQQERTDLLV